MPEQASTNLVPFIFEKHEVRVVMINDEPWFVAKDVLMALEYAEASLSNILSKINHVPEQWRGRLSMATLGGTQELWCLSEQGLYFFVARSDKPKALPFQMWLARDVLPSIRRTGSYSATPQLSFVQPAAEFKALFEVANLILDKNQAALAVNKAVRRTTGVDLLEQLGSPPLIAPKQERLLTVTEIGKQLGFSARDTNIALEYFRYQREARDHNNKLRWELTEKGKQHGRYLDIDKRRGNGTPILQVKWYESVVPVLRADLDAMSKAMEELND